MDHVVEAIERREKVGGRFAIVVCAEGAISKEEKAMPSKEYKAKVASRVRPSVAYDIADEISLRTNREVRVAVPGHTQRGGAPDAQDRVLATQCGVEAARCFRKGQFGIMIAKVDGRMTTVPLEEVAGKLKTVDPKCDLIREAKAMGISFGDE
jgi:6-phosphofructokinase